MLPLITYIENQLKAGVTREVITTQLLGQGWQKNDIDKAFISLEMPQQVVSSVASTASIQKKSHVGLIIILVFLLTLIILIGAGAWMYFNFIVPLKDVSHQPIVPVSTSTPMVTATTTLVVATSTVYVPSKPKPAPVSTPVSTSPVPKPIAQTPVKTPGTWQNDPKMRLCWDGLQTNCEAGTGYYDVYNVIDVKGDGSLLLGAVEYCKYLDPNGSTLDKTIQNFWHLPTINELMSLYAKDPSSFHYMDTGYWSVSTNSEGISPGQADYVSVLSDGSFSSSYESKINALYVRCVQ